MIARYALVTLPLERDNPAAYMPANYAVLHVEDHPENNERRRWRQAVIGGRDSCGWTLDSYVLPRLASGGMYGVEIDLSHEVMKRVPAWPTPGAVKLPEVD
jgi:hypothetical protein